jgi:hypothetical protein
VHWLRSTGKGLDREIAHGAGAELRVPLGIAIVGGLIVSQMLTLFTTPVVHLWFDGLARWINSSRRGVHQAQHISVTRA